jgi:DNA primase
MTYQEVHKYLTEERKLTPETIKANNIGFFSKQGFLYAGTTFPIEFTQLTDMYSDSLIFPIYDMYGESIGIMARRMHEAKPKYINSSNDNKFTKGKHLYGLNRAIPYILQEDKVIVVEGQFDQIQLFQAGIKNVVCMMGTALSQHQLALLSRFTCNIIILTDPDVAGQKAATKIQNFSQSRITCTTLKLPTKQDPDEYIISEGVNKLKELINNI